MPIDYSKSKIYKIVCNETGETYYGSTTQTLALRLSKHKSKTSRCSSKQIIERGNYDIVLCEEYPCENKEQLHAIERKWIDDNECVNKTIPSRTLKEWYDANKQKQLQLCKIYHESHKEEIKKRQKEYHEMHREEILKRQKEYREKQKQLKEKELQQII